MIIMIIVIAESYRLFCVIAAKNTSLSQTLSGQIEKRQKKWKNPEKTDPFHVTNECQGNEIGIKPVRSSSQSQRNDVFATFVFDFWAARFQRMFSHTETKGLAISLVSQLVFLSLLPQNA